MMHRRGTVAVINPAIKRVAIATEDDGFTIIDLRTDWNIDVDDAMSWANGYGLGAQLYENLTKHSRKDVYVENHSVSRSSLGQQLWPIR